MKSSLPPQSIAIRGPSPNALSDGALHDLDCAGMLDEAMTSLSAGSHSPLPQDAGPLATDRTKATDTRLPILTHARLSALFQHFVTAAAHTSIFALARASEALDEGADHKTLKLEHRAAMTGTGVLCASTALDCLAATAAFLDRDKTARQIKDTQWLPWLANLSQALRPFADHFKTIQNGIANAALFGAVGSAGALWATREGLSEAQPALTPEDDGIETEPSTHHTASTSNRLECAQLAAALASTTVRAIVPPIVTTCVNLDEAKQKRRRYDFTEALGSSSADGPVDPQRFRSLEDGLPVPDIQTIA
ncbi:hypothetical protein DA70_01645 [Pandoraea pnomenusa]|uniref:hypothetical protein n=1 Tax=Pandoraea pnomenusa TaxID=93220 RepID=UPI00043764CB|nr:hypothetical protein [Pandoraea pnomenusa]AHN77276.3 hypothetical protein DA70_01645 [Pandoraea pnomenusa]